MADEYEEKVSRALQHARWSAQDAYPMQLGRGEDPFWSTFWFIIEPSAARRQSYQRIGDDGDFVYCERCDSQVPNATSSIVVHNGRRHEEELDT